MAIALRSVSYASAALNDDLTPTEPAGAAENDRIIAFAYGEMTGGTTWTDPADFTQIDQFDTTVGSPNRVYYLGEKKRGSDAGNGYNFSHDSADAPLGCSLICLSGVDTTAMLDVTFSTQLGGYRGELAGEVFYC